MAGISVTAAPATGLVTTSGGTGTGTLSANFNPSYLNDLRVSAVIDRLSIHLHSNSTNIAEFENLCNSLSRGIDFSIANHEVPNRSRELPSLIKKVCLTKNDVLLQAAIMVLMISVKSACQNGWFPDQDSEELTNLAKMIASKFCNASYFIAEPHPSHLVISTVMSRFYPRLKMSHIFVSLEVKPGFDAYISDFQISKSLKCSTGDKIRLFVVQTDSLETSSCLVTPAKVNFLLNGKGVETRSSLFLDTGPQVPTVVTPLVKYGANLLQAIGEFNGNFIIIVAFMTEVPNPDSSTLQICEQPAPATVHADSEVIEGSSRISLNCPISFKRIKSPVKGVSCKHIQCFDFNNYVDINSRRPSWRCPHCNQHVCFSDICIDQKMVKVLNEVGPNISDIIVSADGSWNAVMESEDKTEKPDNKTLNVGQEESPQPADILDLTLIDDPIDVDTSDIQDKKQFSDTNAQTGYWAEVLLSTLETGSLNTLPNVQAAGGAATAPHTATSSANPVPFPHYQLGNSPITSDYGRLSSVPIHITRTASAVQALPAQSPAPFLQRSSSNGASPFTTNGLSPASQASPAAPNSTSNRASPHQVPPMPSLSQSLQHSTLQRNRSFPSTQPPQQNATLEDPNQVPPMPSLSQSLQHSTLQQNRSFPSTQPPHQNASLQDPNQVPNMYRIPNEHQNSSQPVNLRIPQLRSQSPGAIHSSLQSSTSLLRPQGHAGVSKDRSVYRTGAASGQQSHLITNANRGIQMAVGDTRGVPSYSWNPDGHNTPNQRGMSGVTPSSQPVTGTDGQGSADMNWRPAGRMRGALSGQAYDEAFQRYIVQPNQQAQDARPVSNTTPLPNNGMPTRPGFIAAQTVVSPSSASAVPIVRPAGAGSDVSPNTSSAM